MPLVNMENYKINGTEAETYSVLIRSTITNCLVTSTYTLCLAYLRHTDDLEKFTAISNKL